MSFAPTCLACSCEHRDESERFDESDLVFTGRVTDGHQRPDGDRVWRFDVESGQKGERPETVDIVTGPEADSCAPTFTLDNRYQVFAVTEDGDFRTDFCMGTKSVGRSVWPYAAEDGGPTAKPHGGRPVPTVPPGSSPLPVFDERVTDPREDPEASTAEPVATPEAREAREDAPEDDSPTDEAADGDGGNSDGQALPAGADSSSRARDYAIAFGVWTFSGIAIASMLQRRKRRPS